MEQNSSRKLFFGTYLKCISSIFIQLPQPQLNLTYQKLGLTKKITLHHPPPPQKLNIGDILAVTYFDQTLKVGFGISNKYIFVQKIKVKKDVGPKKFRDQKNLDTKNFG